MSKINGISKENSETVTEELNIHIANLMVSAMNIKGYHWNIVGSDFFELHEKYDELNSSLLEMVDGLAERIVTLGFIPHHTFQSFIEDSTIQPKPNIKDQRKTVVETVGHLNFLVGHQRELIRLTDKFEDVVSSDLLTEYLRKIEKFHWMFSAYLG